MGKSILLIAGELSGDMHAAAIVRALRAQQPDLHVFGIGGDQLRAAGMEVLVDSSQMAVLGLTDVLRRLAFFRKTFRDMLELAHCRRPDAVVLVDYPGFNLRFAARARAMGLKVIYYICPQVWAWNRARIPRMAKIIDRLLTIFPFETEIFHGTGLAVDFVGHPLVEKAQAAQKQPLADLPWQNGSPRIALLPGSRYHEIKRILPVMRMAALLLERQYPETAFIVAAPSDQAADWIQNTLPKKGGLPQRWHVVVDQTREVLRQACAAWVTSGTATIEAALMRCPLIVVYKTSWPTYICGRNLVQVPWLGMVNIVAGTGICPEFIQHHATPSALFRAMLPLVVDGSERNVMLAGLERVSAALGAAGGAEQAARIILEELNSEFVFEKQTN